MFADNTTDGPLTAICPLELTAKRLSRPLYVGREQGHRRRNVEALLELSRCPFPAGPERLDGIGELAAELGPPSL